MNICLIILKGLETYIIKHSVQTILNCIKVLHLKCCPPKKELMTYLHKYNGVCSFCEILFDAILTLGGGEKY